MRTKYSSLISSGMILIAASMVLSGCTYPIPASSPTVPAPEGVTAQAEPVPESSQTADTSADEETAPVAAENASVSEATLSLQDQPETGASAATVENGIFLPETKLLKTGLSMAPVNFSITQIDAQKAQELDRSMRDYDPDQATDLIVNEAPSFVYYSLIEPDLQDLYDALYYVAQDPTGSRYFTLISDTDPITPEFSYAFEEAYWALMLDHPELFWLYNGLEDDFTCFSLHNEDETYTLYCTLVDAFSDYEAQLNAFQQAADEALSQIDLTGSQTEIARSVHNYLCSLTAYDYAVSDNEVSQSLAHTAYGALVSSENGAHHAVCDGYSLAYEYLLQQAGIEVCTVYGVAGNYPDDLGGHAWNMAKLDGHWVEIDSTWDDNDDLADLYADSEYAPYVNICLSDSAYRDKIDHTYFMLDSATMRHFVPDESFIYTDPSGWKIGLSHESYHFRESELGKGKNEIKDIQKNLPTATR